MSKRVINVRSLGKMYRLGATLAPDTLREHIMNVARRIVGGKERGRPREDFWALKDVSFEVNEGEVLGVIGANGAGKSTLLKILTGITDPSEGEVHMKGRVASLLEVGTGFHPELTGRENIYMNGAILGMRRAEIAAKFDEIVEFAGVAKFLETPVKRYSSGMRVRLGFAVAAHLEPEVLLIDEVLAVGDISFQKKCLGKMEDVSKGGRTILFVSHNMSAMSALCHRAILLSNGSKVADGPASEVIAKHRSESERFIDVSLADRTDRQGSGLLRFTDLSFSCDEKAQVTGGWVCGKAGLVSLSYFAPHGEVLKNVDIAITFHDADGRPLFVCDSKCVNTTFSALPSSGVVSCTIPRVPLAAGTYSAAIWASVCGEVADFLRGAGSLEIVDGDYFGTGRTTVPSKHGPFLVEHHWVHRP